jgi:ATP-dependent Clp protease ATP-binding subunit ClpB
MACYRLDVTKRSDDVLRFDESLRAKVIGQDAAIDEVVKYYQSFLAGMKMIGRPISNILLLGPTGVGKTLLVEAIAETLFNDRHALLKVNCAELGQSHEVAKLTGSPPGYLGYQEKPIFHQDNVDKHHSSNLKLSLILFDEVEKANSALWKIMLAILDKGQLGLGNGTTTDFTSSFVFMTSNLGSKEINNLHDGYGFSPIVELDDFDSRVESISKQASLKHFSPEFMGRLDSIIVFNSLTHENMRKILDVETGSIQGRIMLSKTPFVVTYSDAAKEQLLAEGYDKKSGARHLKRNLEKNIVFNLTSGMSSKQIGFGDVVNVDYKKGEFTFDITVAKAAEICAEMVVGLRDNEEKESSSNSKGKEYKESTAKKKKWPMQDYF